MTTAAAERGRLTTRLPRQLQSTIEMAAELTGATVNQFIVQAALREAERVLEQERVIRLAGAEAERFLSALEHPAAPNAALTAATQEHKARSDDSTGTLDWTPRSKGV